MTSRNIIIILYSLFISTAYSHTDIKERHIKVGMRMIGDQILLHSGDSTSRVLAIEKDTDRYKIEFESGFSFTPEAMMAIINEVVTETGIATSYLVEVENCETKKVIYSYEVSDWTTTDLIPCKLRVQPKACYKLFVTILDSNPSALSLYNSAVPAKKASSSKSQIGYLGIATSVLFCITMLGLFIYFRREKQVSPKQDLNMILIGQYRFDKKAMTLSLKHETTELSGKEADLLYLLCNSENQTLTREYILEVVWGDEGDYIGRTLDVFVSKLRKKLMADTSIKIINIRGIGYKFIIDNQG
ncbi:response regulator transcription factor [Fulvivirga ulvae]|uniref:winged helix-turn-helix domain-containing protein n=1 Tax=Fulvivirga ulvae TaxID=2904245 RepID=UPI001F160DD1|nr:response regulator transcription factor [Fulvivirga ulvae]UII32327.1 response regulator transcription factor [Fulvivirga ulvae]